MSVRSQSNSITLTRVYNAPVRRVWDAWVVPEQVAEWWGPRGFTLTTRSKDVRPGGIWAYTMHGSDGTNYENKTLFLEVEEGKKLVYDHGGNDEQPPLFRVTVHFSEVGGKTRMDMQMTLSTPEQAEQTRQFIKQAGGDATWDRLSEYLDQAQSGKKRFVITRSFEAPIETLFSQWTDPTHLTTWLPPVGFTMEFIRPDIRQGGRSFSRMTNGDGITLYAVFEYAAIEKPERIEYLQNFADEHEAMSRHPLAPTWPATMKTVVEFTAEGPLDTRVTVTSEPIGNVTAEEVDTFVEGRTGMTLGWTGSFDKLEARLVP